MVDASPVGLGAVLFQTQENGQDRCIAILKSGRSPVLADGERSVGCGVGMWTFCLLEHSLTSSQTTDHWK